jgi:hypothetical protein
MEEKDSMRELCIQQGYVPQKCKLPGMLVYGLINKGENPCNGCNENREKCGGNLKTY